METNGSELRRLRNERALSLRELGAIAGVTQDNIWKIEQGITRRPHPKTIRNLSAALHVEPKALLRLDKDDGDEEGE